MMKYAVKGVFLYIAILLQGSLFIRLGINGIRPDFVMAVLVCMSISEYPAIALIFAGAAGVSLDLLYGSSGLYTLQYLPVALVIALVSAKINFGRLILPSIACFVFYFVKELAVVFYLILAHRALINIPSAAGMLLVGGIYTTALMLPIRQLVIFIDKFTSIKDGAYLGRLERR